MKIRVLAVLAALCLLWACYPAASEATYTNPQSITSSQWLIDHSTTDNKLELTMRYRRTRDTGFSYHDSGSNVTLDQLTGLTRGQLLSATGCLVRFQLERDAGTFAFEGWFKQGNGSGHFNFTPNN